MLIVRRKKGSKYNNEKAEYDGIKFASKKERDRYVFLKDAEQNGIISELKLQVKYELIPSIKETYTEHLKTKDVIKNRTIQLAINYVCDFEYYHNGELITEDVKASPKMIPKEFILKEKLFFWKYNRHIKKVYKATDKL